MDQSVMLEAKFGFDLDQRRLNLERRGGLNLDERWVP